MTAITFVQLFALSAIWGASFLLIKFATAEFPATWVAGLRLLFGTSFLWLALFSNRVGFVPRAKWGWVAFLGLTNNAIPFVLFAIAERSVGSSLAAIINATTTIFSALIAVGLRDSSFGLINGIGVALGFLGVLLAVSGGFSTGTATLTGVAMLLFASFCYSLSGFVVKRRLVGVPPIAIATGQLSSALLMILPIAAFAAPSAMPSTRAWLAVLTLGIVGSGIAYLLMYSVLQKVSPTQMAAVTYLLPIWGLFWATIDGEPIDWLSVLGVAVILSSMYVINQKPRAARASQPFESSKG